MQHGHCGKLTRSVVLRAAIIIGKMNVAHLAALRPQAPHGPGGHCSFLRRNCLHPSRAKATLQSWASLFVPRQPPAGRPTPTWGVRLAVPAWDLRACCSFDEAHVPPRRQRRTGPSHRSASASSITHRPEIFTNNVERGILHKRNFHFSI